MRLLNFKAVISLFFFALPFSAFAALSQADLAGHWAGTLTDPTGQTTFNLDFTVDASGAITGTGDGRPLANSKMTAQSSGTSSTAGVGGVNVSLHWFYIDTGYNFVSASPLDAIPLVNNQFHVKDPIAASFYIVPGTPHDIGNWTLDIMGGKASTQNTSSFTTKLGAETKSKFKLYVSLASVLLNLPKSASGKPTLTGLTNLTLTIGSASFPIATKASAPLSAKLQKGTLFVQAKGLNLISLLTIDPTMAYQTATTPVTISGVSPIGNPITLFTGTFLYQINIVNGVATATGTLQ